MTREQRQRQPSGTAGHLSALDAQVKFLAKQVFVLMQEMKIVKHVMASHWPQEFESPKTAGGVVLPTGVERQTIEEVKL